MFSTQNLAEKKNEIFFLLFFFLLLKLKFLVLDNNLLTELDEKLKNLEKLEILCLNHNLLTSIDSNLLRNSLNYLKQLGNFKFYINKN